jgi:amino acid transporter
VLISTGDIGELADTTVLLLLGVFAIVNVTVLVLRRDAVEGPHFRAPSILPVLGAVVSLVLIYDKLADDATVGLRAGLLLVLGAVLWLVNRLVFGAREAQR